MKLKKIFEEDLLVSCFSFNGTINRRGFLGFVVGLLLPSTIFPNTIWLLLSVFVFYTMLSLIQRRCRDFNYNGTIFVAIYSVYFLILICTMYMHSYWQQFKKFLRENESCAYTYFGIVFVYYISLLLLVLIPEKKEKDLTLRSPLLKHPWKYVAFCYSIYIICLAALIYWRYNYMPDV